MFHFHLVVYPQIQQRNTNLFYCKIRHLSVVAKLSTSFEWQKWVHKEIKLIGFDILMFFKCLHSRQSDIQKMALKVSPLFDFNLQKFERGVRMPNDTFSKIAKIPSSKLNEMILKTYLTWTHLTPHHPSVSSLVP